MPTVLEKPVTELIATADGLFPDRAYAIYRVHRKGGRLNAGETPRSFVHKRRTYRVTGNVTVRDLCLVGLVETAVKLNRAANPWLTNVIFEGRR